MDKLRNKISILLMCLMFFVIISTNIRTNALEFSHIKGMTGTSSDASIITEYQVDENVYLEIDSISLETAVDNTCETTEYIPADDVVSTAGDAATVGNSASLYYVGETDEQGNLIDNKSYYVEDWQELEGELSIKVNKEASCVTVYKGETPIRAMVCSAGESTPEGTFYMDNQWYWLNLIKGQYGRYCSQISGDYLFHSVPYNSMDIYDLDTEMYNQLGTLCSHGCIRLKVEDAKWIYDNCSAGTEITIYNDSNPGPMGKPGFEKIPDTQTWDPTDTDINE